MKSLVPGARISLFAWSPHLLFLSLMDLLASGFRYLVTFAKLPKAILRERWNDVGGWVLGGGEGREV